MIFEVFKNIFIYIFMGYKKQNPSEPVGFGPYRPNRHSPSAPPLSNLQEGPTRPLPLPPTVPAPPLLPDRAARAGPGTAAAPLPLPLPHSFSIDGEMTAINGHHSPSPRRPSLSSALPLLPL
jgi:hypothetical protein